MLKEILTYSYFRNITQNTNKTKEAIFDYQFN